MESRLRIGDKRTFVCQVSPNDVAAFDSGVVHPVCSTFSLAKNIEWASRLFVIDIKNEDEEGIGTMLHIEHFSPALVGHKITYDAVVTSFEKNELLCDVSVTINNRVIAKAKTGQKILKKDKINQIFSSLADH
jgi:predicted thioesterase